MVKLIFIILTAVLVCNAQEKTYEKKPPTVITADKAEFYNKDRMVIYTGNVEVNRGNFYLRADSIKIYLDSKSDIARVFATGSVTFKQEGRWGKAEEAEYIKDQDLIILRKKAEIHQDKNSVEGEIIYYYISEERAVSTGQKERVRSVFFPKDKEGR